jgi:5-methylcytosine-specific restriction endonuclease McrA
MISREIYRQWYGSGRWRKLRAQVIKANPWCVMCKAAHISRQATIVDHIRPHRGDESLFWDVRNLQPICKPCHDGAKQAFERSGKIRQQVGLDGWVEGG